MPRSPSRAPSPPDGASNSRACTCIQSQHLPHPLNREPFSYPEIRVRPVGSQELSPLRVHWVVGVAQLGAGISEFRPDSREANRWRELRLRTALRRGNASSRAFPSSAALGDRKPRDEGKRLSKAVESLVTIILFTVMNLLKHF